MYNAEGTARGKRVLCTSRCVYASVGTQKKKISGSSTDRMGQTWEKVMGGRELLILLFISSSEWKLLEGRGFTFSALSTKKYRRMWCN